MSTFLLIRHALHDYVSKALVGWMPGVHINETGREQALRLAERLSGTKIDGLFSSPLERALETAEPVSRRLGLTVEIRDSIGEIRCGEWTGREFDSLAGDPLWRRFNTFRSSTRPPGGELIGEVQTRIVTEMERLRCLHPGATLALVSHGDVIKAAVMHFAGIPLDLLHRIEISPASVTTIEVEDWGTRILGVNSTL